MMIVCLYIQYLLVLISVVFHNRSVYDYHSMIKELAEEFERRFECLGQ